MRTGYSLPPHPINIVNLRVGEWETGNYDEKNNLHTHRSFKSVLQIQSEKNNNTISQTEI